MINKSKTIVPPTKSDVTKAITSLRALFIKRKQYFNTIINDVEELKNIAPKSYRHLNGFTKIVLKDNKKDNVKIRLHIWHTKPDINSLNTGDVHDHRWSYVSIPIMGSFKETRYKETLSAIDNDENIKYRYKCYSRGETEWLNLEGFEKVELYPSEMNTRTKGKAYLCPAGEIHTIEPIEYPSASIVMTFKPKRKYARVYRNQVETTDFMKIYAPSLKPVEVKQALEFVLK